MDECRITLESVSNKLAWIWMGLSTYISKQVRNSAWPTLPLISGLVIDTTAHVIAATSQSTYESIPKHFPTSQTMQYFLTRHVDAIRNEWKCRIGGTNESSILIDGSWPWVSFAAFSGSARTRFRCRFRRKGVAAQLKFAVYLVW